MAACYHRYPDERTPRSTASAEAKQPYFPFDDRDQTQEYAEPDHDGAEIGIDRNRQRAAVSIDHSMSMTATALAPT